MLEDKEYIKTEPSASLLIESIRDIGYSIETAIADLIDNSISVSYTHLTLPTKA